MLAISLEGLVNYLDLKTGLFWSIIWFFIILFLQKKSTYKALCEGIHFLIIWCIISIIFYLFCIGNIFCI